MKILVNNEVKQMTSEQEASLIDMPDQTTEATLEEKAAAYDILMGLEE